MPSTSNTTDDNNNAAPNQEFTTIVLSVGIHKHIGITLDEQDHHNKTATAHFTTHDALMTPTGTLHGGIIYSCCDSIAYLALIPLFDSTENAATEAITVNAIRAVSGVDQRVELRAKVLHKGRRTAFIESSMWWQGKLVATALVTKAIINQLPKGLTKEKQKKSKL